jgi:diguanylate cyclase (GGDEF)-like protein
MLPKLRIAPDGWSEWCSGDRDMAERPARRSRERPGVHTTVARREASGAAADGTAEHPLGRDASPAARLAAEVERLEAELGAMRRRLVELEACAERDPLTGVLNRRGFERELVRALAYLDRYPGNARLVYLDLDGFKPVNDTCGHAAGDAVLVAVAATLTRLVRASDMVARLGGDEFAVLLWNLGEADAGAKARALEAAVAAVTVPWEGASLAVGASAGVVPLMAGDRPADAVARADAAMYARKHARRR